MSKTAMADRNQKIVESLRAGTSVAALAQTYKLSQSRIRAIRAQYASTPSANGASSSGSASATDTRATTLGEIGLSGLNYSHGYVEEDFLKELRTSTGRYKLFDEMRKNDPVIAGSLLAMELSIRRVDWRIDGDDADPRTEFVQGAWEDMSQSPGDHLGEALTMLPFGWSFFEIVYKRRLGAGVENARSNFNDGKIGWRKLAFRSQDSLDSWVFDDHGNVQAMVQRTWPRHQTITLPLEKGLLYRTSREKNNPEGRSLLRPAYVPYYYAKNLRAIEAIGAERDLAGLPKVVLPESADTSSDTSGDVQKAKQLVQRIRQDEMAGVVLPFGWTFDLIGSAGGKQHSIAEIISRYETRMAMSMLTQFILLGMNSVGTQALSTDLTGFFVQAATTFADSIAETFSQYAIPRLLKLNGMPLENAPKLAHGPLGKADLAGISSYFQRLTQYVKADDDLEQYLRQQAEAPEISEIELKRREKAREQAPAPPSAPAPESKQDGDPDMPMDEGEMPANPPQQKAA